MSIFQCCLFALHVYFIPITSFYFNGFRFFFYFQLHFSRPIPEFRSWFVHSSLLFSMQFILFSRILISLYGFSSSKINTYKFFIMAFVLVSHCFISVLVVAYFRRIYCQLTLWTLMAAMYSICCCYRCCWYRIFWHRKKTK